jgi:general L-amino acid transport system permease protein
MLAKSPAPVLPPPQTSSSLVGWLRANLFSTWYNTLLTLALVGGLALVARPIWHWVFAVAHWRAVTINLRLFMVGLYPTDQVWRPGVLLILLAWLWGGSTASNPGVMRNVSTTLLTGLVLLTLLLTGQARVIVGGAALALLGGYGLGGRWPHTRRLWPIGWFLSLPLILIVLGGMRGTDLPPVVTTQWGGLMLTLLLAAVGIVASFPLGLLLALGRQSRLPVIRWCAIAYIELVRGVPLVSVLMMFSLLLPLFLPASWGRPNTLLRILVGMTLFTAAYIAENVRGGLQAIPRGQYEAATALGLTWVQAMRYIILPQALRAVIPALVGQCISLFKDTSLVTIIGSLELLGIAKSVIEQAEWKNITGGVVFEVFLFTAVVYGVFTYSMSSMSRRLETTLGVGTR